MRQANSFDTLRLMGALMVLFGHAFSITGTGQAPLLGTIAVHTLGVCLFFSISGFLIAQSWLSDPHPLRFLHRRALRIFPALLVVVTVSALIIGPWMTTEPLQTYFRHGWTYRYILSNAAMITVTGLPHVFDDLPIVDQVNSSLWTLPIEFAMYLLVPLMVLGHRVARGAASAAVLIVVIAVLPSVAAVRGWGDATLHGIQLGNGLGVVPYFLAGCALRLVDFGAWPAKWRLGALAVSALAVGGWTVSGASAQPWAVVPIAIFVLALGLTDWLHMPLIDRAGDLSYGTYLWAFPVQQVTMQLGGGGVAANLAVALPVTLALAFASWRLVERPALRFKPRRRTHPEEEHPPATGDAALQTPATASARG